MTVLAGQVAFSASTSRRRVSAQVSAGVLSLALALGSPLCQAAHSVVPAHDGDIGWVSPERESGQSLGVDQTERRDNVCCHLLAMREDATGKSPMLLPQGTFTSALLGPSLASWVYLVPVTRAVQSMHRIPPPTTPLERFTDKLVL